LNRIIKGNILLVQLGDIGDVVLTFPAIQALKENFPENKLVVCVRDKAKDLMEDCVWSDKVISIGKQKENIKDEIIYQFNFLRALRRCGVSVAIDLRTGTRGAILTFLSGAPYRIGRFADDGKLWRNRLFTQLVKPVDELKQYAAEHNLNMISPLNVNIQNRIPRIIVSDQRKKEALAIFQKEGMAADKAIFIIHPFSLWKFKEWNIDQWVLLVDYLVERFQCNVIITGSAEEQGRAREILDRSRAGVFNLAGKTSIGLLPAIMQACRFFIGVDTAALHIAAAVGTPTIGIFGPSSPTCWAPRGDSHYVVSKMMPCVPCRDKGCQNSEFSRCLDELSFMEVREKVEAHFSPTRDNPEER
jgi:ADP-heptose:LPS heptosyltransferase